VELSQLSRRHLLGGLSLLPLALPTQSSASVFLRLLGRPPTAPASTPSTLPVVGPAVAWNGTAKSGGTPPTDPTRTTAKPAIHWLMPSDLRLVSNVVIGVDADCSGTAGGSLFGVKQVDFWVEGTVQTVTSPMFYTDTDANGSSRTRWGYWIALNAAAFKAVSTTGEARIYATAVPNDTTMQSRVIGYDGYTSYDGNYPMSVFPRAAQNDRSKTVRLDGTGDFTTLIAAIDDAATFVAGGGEAPLITITQTGSYEAANTTRTIGAGWPVAKSRCQIAAGSGVTATLGRAARAIGMT
jgi:hypothetical protein